MPPRKLVRPRADLQDASSRNRKQPTKRHLRAQCRTLEALPGRLSPSLIRPRVSNCRCGLAVGHRAGMLRSRAGHLRHVSAPQDRYLFRTTSRPSPIGRAEDSRERETSEIRHRTGGSGPPPRTALQNSKLLGMFPEFAAGRLDESQPAIPSPKLALQIDPYSPASTD